MRVFPPVATSFEKAIELSSTEVGRLATPGQAAAGGFSIPNEAGDYWMPAFAGMTNAFR